MRRGKKKKKKRKKKKEKRTNSKNKIATFIIDKTIIIGIYFFLTSAIFLKYTLRVVHNKKKKEKLSLIYSNPKKHELIKNIKNKKKN